LDVALKRIARLNCPIFVTEFGLPDANDNQRPRFLVRHMQVVHRAISGGLNVRGVFHWSLTDNFEWAEGWGLRFGLVALNQLTQERADRPSAQVYARMARANAIPDDLLESM
jgi:beta-glucosidase